MDVLLTLKIPKSYQRELRVRIHEVKEAASKALLDVITVEEVY